MSEADESTSPFVKKVMVYIKRYISGLPLWGSIFLVLLPLIVVGAYLCVREFNHQTRIALERREVLAELGASIVHEKLDNIVGAGISIASRSGVYESIEKGDWKRSVEGLDYVRQMLPHIDAISVLDRGGVLRAVTPPIPGIIGVDYSYRDYYKGVSRSWEPYVSPAFVRSVDPKDPLVAVAIPVRASSSGVTGVIVLTVKLDAVTGWSREIRAGESGLAYVIDSKGQLVAHPRISSKGALVDYSSVSATQKLLRGEKGVEVSMDPMEKEQRLTAYSPVERYGFGVAIAEPTRTAFADRKENVSELVLVWLFIVVSVGLSSYIILKDRSKIKVQLEKEKTLFESIGDGVIIIDRAWNIVLLSKAASEITGWSKDEVVGRPFREVMKFINGHNRKENYAFIEEVFHYGKTISLGVGTLLVKKDGTEFPVGDSASPILGEKGEVVGVIIIFRDATKEQEVMHLRSGFVYASHQLRTPITEALWNLSLVGKEEDLKKRMESVGIVEKSLMSIQRLSEHLVSVSEVDQGNIVAKPTLVKVADLFEGLPSMFFKLAKDLTMTISFEPVSSFIAIETDPTLVKKTLKEIIGNALLYGLKGSEVEVKTTITTEEVVFEISNEGEGIPEDEQPIIFTKFFRASSHPPHVPGSGLGLYLAREYTRKLGGKIWFESEEGKRTTFFIALPIHTH